MQLGAFLSEEITPADWATLVSTVASRLAEGNASGIVIAHGTDTLSYTASLLYWFFADTSVPIVLTAAAVPWEAQEERMQEDSEAVRNLKAAVRKATGNDPGVHVVFDTDDYSPINLKFERLTDAEGLGRFRNWNLNEPVFAGHPVSTGAGGEMPVEELIERFESAIRSVYVARVFPGMQGESLVALINAGIRYFILELYDTGTASLRETPYSLKKAFEHGQERGVVFFCTSQQEGAVDFSEYVTSHELWKEGAIPMGTLTTESVFTRLVTALVTATDHEEVLRRMEERL